MIEILNGYIEVVACLFFACMFLDTQIRMKHIEVCYLNH